MTMTKACVFKVGDRICIGKQPLLEENLAYYGAHGVVTEVSYDAVRVDFGAWEEHTGVKQEIALAEGMDPKEWFMSATVWRDEGTKRFAFLR